MHDLEKSTVIRAPAQDPSAKKQMYRRLVNLLLFEELGMLEGEAMRRGLRVARLKGASLLPRYYSDLGDRHLSDIDVLVAMDQREQFESLLRERGYRLDPILEWEATRNRQSWIKSHASGIQLSIDLHVRLYWRQPKGLENLIVHDEQGFWRLREELELLHLIVNWIEQDTCVSPEKLDDIHRVYLALQPSVDWRGWWSWVKGLGHGRSVRLAFGLLREHRSVVQPAIPYRMDFRDRLALGILASIFGRDPREHRVRYWILKHLTRPFYKAILYDWLWVSARTRSFFGRWSRRGFYTKFAILPKN